MILNVHAGHNTHTTGASAILDETKEDRIVKDEVIRLLKAAGHTVYDCTDDYGKDLNGNLSNIVKKCNSHKVDLDVSLHLNSARNDLKGDNETGGVEVWIYSDDSKAKTYAQNICKEVSTALGVHNRGVKVSGNNLYVLRYTNSPALLIECVFVDDKDDAVRWDAKACAKAIVTGLIGDQPVHKPTTPTSKPKYIVNNKVGLLQKAINKDCGTKLVIDNSCGPATLEQLKKINIWAYPDKTCRKYPNIMKFVQTQLGGLAVDGSYGPATKSKVKVFQQKHGLVTNAVIGINTLKKLCE